MGYSACGLPWIDTVVNSYAVNSTQNTIYDPTFTSMCCLGPGQCSVQSVDKCPYGYLSCQMGNSRNVCTFFDLVTTSNTNYECYQKGTLANTRNIKCCNPILSSFIQGAGKCLSSHGASGNSQVCCTDSSDVGSCEWALICMGYESIGCLGGDKTAICTGYESGYCANEFTLGSSGGSDCAAATAPDSGCILGGSGPIYVPNTNITASPSPSFPPPTSTASGPSASVTNPSVTGSGIEGPVPTNAGKKRVSVSQKGILALCVLAPLLSQLLFL